MSMSANASSGDASAALVICIQDTLSSREQRYLASSAALSSTFECITQLTVRTALEALLIDNTILYCEKTHTVPLLSEIKFKFF